MSLKIGIGIAFAVWFGGGSPALDLSDLAPAGVLDHAVTVYVAPDALYIALAG